MKLKNLLPSLVACCLLISISGSESARARPSEAEMDAYTERISDKLCDTWQNLNSKEYERKIGPTTMVVTIDGRGGITDIKVEHSSGDKARDLSVINAIRKLPKVEAPPDKEPFLLSVEFATDPQVSRILSNNLGVKALQTNDFDQAIKKLTEVWKNYPGNVLARENLATAYNNRALTKVKEKKLAEARDDLEQAYAIDPRILTLTNIETVYRLNRDPLILKFLLKNVRSPQVSKFGPIEELFELYAKVAIDCQSAHLNKECLETGLLALHLDSQNKQIKWKEMTALKNSMALAQSGLKKKSSSCPH